MPFLNNWLYGHKSKGLQVKNQLKIGSAKIGPICKIDKHPVRVLAGPGPILQIRFGTYSMQTMIVSGVPSLEIYTVCYL